MICTLPILIILVQFTNKLSTGVLDRCKLSHTIERPIEAGHPTGFVNPMNKCVDSIKHGWIEYKQQPVLPASLAYVFLYFNIVLAPGGLMTAFLTQRGICLRIHCFSSSRWGSCEYTRNGALLLHSSPRVLLNILVLSRLELQA